MNMTNKFLDSSALERADKVLFALYFIFVSVGILFMHSVSRFSGNTLGLGEQTLFYKQLIFAVISIMIMLLFTQIDYRYTRIIVKPFIVISIVLLILVFIPGVGLEIGVARRWINFRFFSFNPSELAKLSLTIYLAHVLVKKRDSISNFVFGLLPPLLLASLIFFIVLLQSGFSIGAIIISVVFSMIFIGGALLRHIFSIILLTLPVLALAIWKVSYRKDRIFAFIDPWSDPSGIGYQSIQSLRALSQGGFFGVGLGNSTQKISRLPAAHTDFIFSIIVEEMGFIGGAVLIALFVWFFIRGAQIALKTRDLYAQMLSFGLTTLVVVHALLNVMIATALMPPTGVSLPFISYGGSSFLVLSIAVGILLNISANEYPSDDNTNVNNISHRPYSKKY
ncbi:MAG: FtsW/RodA/SpoVE family cell cycle protein [Brevinema sp.]